MVGQLAFGHADVNGYTPQQGQQLLPLCCGQAGADRVLPFGAEAGGLAQNLLARPGYVEQAGPAIGRVWPPLEHPLLFQVVDEGDHRAGRNAQPFGYSLLRLPVSLIHRPEQGDVARLQAKSAHDLAEAT